MNEETKIYIIELLIEINDIFTALSDKLNILYFKFEPFLKDISEIPLLPSDSNPDKDKIYTNIQTSLHNINQILHKESDIPNNSVTLQRFRNQIYINTETIQKNLNTLTGEYK